MSQSLPDLDAVALRRLESTIDRLAAEHDVMFSRETVTALVADSIGRLGPIRVTRVHAERRALADGRRAHAPRLRGPDRCDVGGLANHVLDLLKELLP